MPKFVQTGLVTRAVDYKEADRILTILSPEIGKFTAKAPGCRRQGSKLLAAAQPFCYAQFEVYDRLGQHNLSDAQVRDNFYGLTHDLRAYGSACALLSLAEAGAREEMEQRELFVLLVSALKLLAAGGDVDAVALYALAHMGELLGVSPQLHACARCGRRDGLVVFSLPAGGMVCTVCAKAFSTHPANCTKLPLLPLKALREVAELTGYAQALALPDKRYNAKLARLLMAFYGYHLDVKVKGTEYL